MFHPLLVEAAKRTAPHVTLESTEFDVVMGEYPESLDDFDALLVTGSASSSYDDAEWIRRLGRYLRTVYDSEPRIKLFGSCFGHQIISDYILDGYGAKVQKDPGGWEIGVHEIKLNDEFRRLFSSVAPQAGAGGAGVLGRESTPDEAACADVPSSLRLQFVHADSVRLDPSKQLPESWISMGATKHCPVQGFCEPGRVLTFQGHFEFDRVVNTEVIKVFGASWEKSRIDDALRQIDAEDDSEAAAELVLKFFVGQERSGGNGLETPPVSA
jgi:GMP synthase-like glutamine amidotransferase